MLDLILKIVGKLLGYLMGQSRGKAERRIAYVGRYALPVETFLRASFAYYDQIESILSVAGRNGNVTARMEERLFRVSNDALNELAELSNEARTAARLADPELVRRLDEADLAGGSLWGLTQAAWRNTSVSLVLKQLDTARKANMRLAARLRELQV